MSGEFNFYRYVKDTNAWFDLLGLMPFWKPLKPTGMGHHPLPRTHANAKGLPKLGTKYDSPSWYPNDINGSDDLHKQAHQSLKDEGIPFDTKFDGTQAELISKTKNAYSSFSEKGFLKIPSTGEIIAKDIPIK